MLSTVLQSTCVIISIVFLMNAFTPVIRSMTAPIHRIRAKMTGKETIIRDIEMDSGQLNTYTRTVTIHAYTPYRLQKRTYREALGTVHQECFTLLARDGLNEGTLIMHDEHSPVASQGELIKTLRWTLIPSWGDNIIWSGATDMNGVMAGGSLIEQYTKDKESTRIHFADDRQTTVHENIGDLTPYLNDNGNR